MLEILTENPVYKLYHLINYHFQDPKTEHLLLVQRPFTLISLLFLYNIGCSKYGPKFMEKRQALDLRYTIIAFDIFQIAVNVYLFYTAASVGLMGHYNFLCGEIDTEDTPLTRHIAYSCYYYFLLKMTDMLDTVFMVLKKKNRHISFLHMYHHTGMIILTWGNTKFFPGGHHVCLGLYNTFVHSIMYTYYLCAALFPDTNFYSFKKLVTKLQMLQFAVIGLHMCTVLIMPNCNYPKWTLIVLLPQMLIMFILFYDFFRKTYILKHRQPKSTN